MKTNYFSSKKLSIYSVFGLIVLVLTSCSSYQNKSYYDNDGIYGADASKKVANEDQKNNEKYKEYFSNLNKETEEIFTDVENYTSNDSIKNTTNESRNYNSWGSNSSENVIVNVYNNGWNNWGWNNWGWNSWYGSGWGWNGWYGSGWGWNNWGWNNWYGPNLGWGWNGYYGNGWCNNNWNNGYYGNHFAVVNGRRDARTYFSPGRTATVNRNLTFNGSRINSSNPRSFTTTTPRSNTSSGTRVNASNPRNQDATTPRSNSTTPRSNSTTPRSNSTTPRSNDTPRNYSTPRSYNDSPRSSSPSYSPSSSGGGGRSSGNSGGGGRSSGGGGRR